MVIGKDSIQRIEANGSIRMNYPWIDIIFDFSFWHTHTYKNIRALDSNEVDIEKL